MNRTGRSQRSSSSSHVNRFNISIAEIDHLDVWQRATLGVAMINSNRVYMDREFRKIINFIDSSQYAPYLMDYVIEFI